MSTIFEKIIEREILGHFIYEDEVCVAILDAFPTVPGQTLVIPRKPVDYAFDLDDETYLHIMKIAKMIAPVLDRVFNTRKTCLVIEGLDVPHVHLKLYPLKDSDGPLGEKIHMGSQADPEELKVIATQIVAALEED